MVANGGLKPQIFLGGTVLKEVGFTLTNNRIKVIAPDHAMMQTHANSCIPNK